MDGGYLRRRRPSSSRTCQQHVTAIDWLTHSVTLLIQQNLFVGRPEIQVWIHKLSHFVPTYTLDRSIHSLTHTSQQNLQSNYKKNIHTGGRCKLHQDSTWWSSFPQAVEWPVLESDSSNRALNIGVKLCKVHATRSWNKMTHVLGERENVNEIGGRRHRSELSQFRDMH